MISNRDAPTFYVKILPPGMAPQPIDVSEKVITFEFDDNESMADKLSIDLDNFDLAFFDDPNWKKGNTLEVAWGYAGNTTDPRQCIITSIKGSRVMKVEALAKSILMNKNVKTRVFDNMKRSDVVKQIAQENGYDASNIQDTEVVVPHIQQARMTDAQLMMHLAKREGFQFFVGPDGLHFGERNMNAAPIRQLVYYTDPEQGDILDFNVENDVTAAPGLVTAKGRDPLKSAGAAVDITANASNTDTTRDGTAPLLEVVDPRTKTTNTIPIAQDATLLSSAVDPASAKREADGKFKLAQQATVILTVSVVGDPALAAKKIIDIQGISKRLSGKYYVKSAKHKLTATEYVTELSVRSDGSNTSPAATSDMSDATQNQKPAADPNALTPKEVVDPRTKTTTTQWVAGGES